MKITKLAMSLLTIGIIAGCSTNSNDQSESQSSSATYETKDLTTADIEKVVYGDSIETVYETLGKPLKEWSSEFVYEELDSSIERDEFMLITVDEGSEMAKDYNESIEQAKKAKEINKLKLLQYTYTYDGADQTALFWISPRTDTVVHSLIRGFIDENGKQLDEGTDGSLNESADASEEEINIPTMNYAIGDTVSFESNEGDEMDVTVNSVSKYAGDDWDIPEGNFFAKVDFTISNIGANPLDVNSQLFEFYDAEGFKSESISKDYFSETIQPGKSAKGVVYFDVISDGSTFEVYFADTVWAGEYQ